MAVQRGTRLLSGGRVIDPLRGVDDQLDVLIRDGCIEGVGPKQEFAGAEIDERVNVEGLLVVPGLIDIHVHLREPGQEWKETIETGSQAAVAGGFTAVCCMPNTNPINDCSSVTEFILRTASAVNLCRVLPIGAITVGSKGEGLSPMLELKEAGCVAFSDDGWPVVHAGIMRRALEYNKMLGTVLTVHEEEPTLSDGFSMNESALSLKMGLRGMPDAAENVMISRDIELARLTDGRVHFCHVSTGRGVTLIRRAKEDGIPVTAEVSPHHLTLDQRAVEGYNTNAKMSMPLRAEEDVQALREGLSDGVIDCIASDHAPHEIDSKDVEFDRASFGILGLQTTVPLTMALVRSGALSIERAVASLSTEPAKCFGMEPNSVQAGTVADLTILDPEAVRTLTPDMIRSKSHNTPFLGEELRGHAVRTIVEGRDVYVDGEVEPRAESE